MASIETKPRLKGGETLSLSIEELSPRGLGIGFVGNEPIHVREGLPGDRLKVRLTRIRPGRPIEAKRLEIENGSADRVVPPCSHFGPCGGCDLQHMAYRSQVDWKARTLARILREVGNLPGLPEIQVAAMEDPWSYRSKMEFSFGQEGDRVTLGFHERASFQRIVDVTFCHIASPVVSELLKGIKEVANRFPLRSYNPKIHQGFWRYAVVRSSLAMGELMLLLVTNEGPPEPIEALKEELPKKVPSLRSFSWGVSSKVSDVASPERIKFMYGSEVLEDWVDGVRFKIRPTNFVQPNLVLAGRIYEAIRQAAGLCGQEAVYDLYCGIGLIALSLAGKAKAVYGVESDPENVTSAQVNAELNGITHATFLEGKVEDLLKGRALFKAGLKPDVIVVDPPRAGLHWQVYAPLLEARAPKLLYLSCNAVSLANDLRVLLTRDPSYRVETIQLFDFFPHTTHLEVLVTLHRA